MDYLAKLTPIEDLKASFMLSLVNKSTVIIQLKL